MGIPAFEIDEWPEKELVRYSRHINQHFLPQSRNEFYFAQMALMVARFGGADAQLRDFMLTTDQESQEHKGFVDTSGDFLFKD